jgi:hypothetical protein
MRGDDRISGSLFSYIDVEDGVRADHPLRAIREIANAAQAAPSRDFAALYSGRRLRGSALPAFGIAVIVLAQTGCAPVQGFTPDPACSSTEMATLATRIDAAQKVYDGEGTVAPMLAVRTAYRDRIVNARIAQNECNYNEFQARLWGDANIISLAGDLSILTLAGLGATIGNAATSSALAAASAGVVGAQAAISKDLYYQRTLPALMAQMTANRERVKAAIYENIKTDDDTYPLGRAQADLGALARASGLPAAIENVIQTATEAKIQAEQETANVLGVSVKLSPDVRGQVRALSQRIFDDSKSSDKASQDELAAISKVLDVTKLDDVADWQSAIRQALFKAVRSDADWVALKVKLASENVKL